MSVRRLLINSLHCSYTRCTMVVWRLFGGFGRNCGSGAKLSGSRRLEEEAEEEEEEEELVNAQSCPV